MTSGVQWTVVLILLKNPTQYQKDSALKKRIENVQNYFSFASLINRPILGFFPTCLLLVLSYISNRQYFEMIFFINNIPYSQQALYLEDDAYG